MKFSQLVPGDIYGEEWRENPTLPLLTSFIFIIRENGNTTTLQLDLLLLKLILLVYNLLCYLTVYKEYFLKGF